jgi:hypothetical protein
MFIIQNLMRYFLYVFKYEKLCTVIQNDFNAFMKIVVHRVTFIADKYPND